MTEYNIAPCGINCDLCHTYQRGNCPGCRHKADETRKSCGNCVILRCDKKTYYCFECPSIPCKRLKTFDTRYRSKYKMSLIDNLLCIQNKGEDIFTQEQKQKYTCPECGKLRTVHYDYCIYCKEARKK